MESKQLQIDLLDQIEAFEASVSGDAELTMYNFITFLNNLDIGNSLSSRNAVVIDSVDIHIAKNTSLMHRYSKFYIKKALKETSLQTVDEYTYLVSLLYVESLTKTELNNLNAMEKTSGSEIIKRLKKNGFIDQRPDEKDRRSIRVFITGKGRAELIKLFPELQKCSNLLSGILSPQQKAAYNSLQNRLCDFHKNIFAEYKEEDLNSLLKHI